MPKVIETQEEKHKRLEARHGYHTCTICKSKFPAVNLATEKHIPKSKYVKPKFSVTVNTFRLSISDVCFGCIERMTQDISKYLYDKIH